MKFIHQTIYRERRRERERERERERRERERGERREERERENSKTLFDKDCSLGSVKNLTTSPCSATDAYKH